MKKYELNKGPNAACPHCGSGTQIRTSREIAPLSREIYFLCRNLECGHYFVAQLVVTHTIVPSRTPRPGIVLRVHEPTPRQKPANDDVPPPANDVDLPGTPANDMSLNDTVITAPG